MRTRFAAATLTALTVTAITPACTTVTGGTAAHLTSSTSAAGSAATSPPAPPTPTTVSDEDQIRQTVTAFQDAYNTQNWQAYTELMCTAMRAQFTGPVMDYVKKGRAEAGLTQVTITSVTVTGDTAIAAMNSSNEALGTRSVTLPLKLEDGWKICKVS
ncbi:hypothetical protein BZL29_7984 [Mycobacterium kansasii]|uniref:Lipoprotein n=1 Tax=Mycobacterium kansasii TaxID=1768 RepID=A0A1V3WE66_MYCKA|nr:hypothetical protein BZL29_7984 [Mycobacterium kansasii]